MKRSFLSILISFIIIILLATPALASVITGAIWQGVIRITNAGASAASYVSTNMTLSSAYLVSNGYANSSLTDVAIQVGGADVPFMPGHNTNPWIIQVPSIGGSQNIDYDFYSGNVTGGKIRYFPDTDGMTTSDNASIEFSDNFTYSAVGRIDTDYGDNKTILKKIGAFTLGVSENVSENITAFVTDNSTASRPDGFSDPASDWTSETDAYDANVSSSAASTGVLATSWTDYLILTFSSPMYSNSVQFYAHSVTGRVDNIDFDAYYDSAWNDVYQGTYCDYKWVGKPYTDGLWHFVSQVRIRMYNSDAVPRDATLQEVKLAAEGMASYAIATGVASGEHDINTGTDANATLFCLGVDNTTASYPFTGENLTFNAPFWHEELRFDVSTSKDIIEHTLTNHGTTWTSTSGRTFNGVNAYIDAGNDASIVDIQGAFTITAWVKATSSATFRRIVSSTDGVNGCVDFLFRNSHYIELALDNLYARSNQIYDDGTWHYVVASWQGVGNPIEIFVDLVETTYSHQDSPGVPTNSSTGIMAIGRRGTNNDSYFLGPIGEVRIYNGFALSADERALDYNATRWKYQGLSEWFHYNVLPAGGVTDTNHDLVSFRYNVMPYVKSQEITISGVQQQYIEWEYGTVFHNSAHSGDDATPTFRTTSSDVNVSAELLSFRPVTESALGSFSLTTLADILTGTPTTPTTMYTELDFTTTPGADPINELLAAGDIPQALWWFPILYISIVLVGLLLYGLTTMSVQRGRVIKETTQDGSLLLMCVVIEVLLVLFGMLNPIPLWPAYLFPIAALTIIISRRHYSWG